MEEDGKGIKLSNVIRWPMPRQGGYDNQFANQAASLL